MIWALTINRDVTGLKEPTAIKSKAANAVCLSISLLILKHESVAFLPYVGNPNQSSL